MGARPPAIPAQTVESLNEQEDIVQVRNIRAQIVDALLNTDGSIPTDDKKLALLKDTLNDMDRSALTRQRIKSDANKNDLTAGARAMVAEMLRNMTNQGASITFTPGATPIDVPARVLELPADLQPTRPLVEGETSSGGDSTTYDEFIKKNELKEVEAPPEEKL